MRQMSAKWRRSWSVMPWTGVLLLMLVAQGCDGKAKGSEEKPTARVVRTPEVSATRVEVASVEKSAARLHLSLPGEVKGSRDALLSAALGGFIEKVNIKNGDKVRKGQVLVTVDSATHQARLEQTRVELTSAEREWNRAKKLGQAMAAQARDAAENRYLAAKAAENLASVQASRAVIRAPFEGVVADVDIEPGEVAGPGVPIVRVVQLDPVKVSLAVADRDVVALRTGMHARVRTDAQSGNFAGEISHINPAADLRTRAFQVEVAVPNDDGRLLPGMIATVTIDEGGTSDDLVVPQDWIVTKLDDLGVFLEKDGKAVWQSVTLGSVVRTQVVVKSGIKAGDRVIITGHRELAEGDPLMVTREGVCCTAGRVVF